jgi:8-oxo-dGTP pyrophosphatase MutT (NUDIX family)
MTSKRPVSNSSTSIDGPPVTELPPLRADLELVRALFGSDDHALTRILSNPHEEPEAPESARAEARPAAVLIALVDEPIPKVLLTQRAANIRYGGHQVFPGGRIDVTDSDARAAMFRECDEEIGLQRDRIEVLGQLADYYIHAGYRITPFVGIVRSPLSLTVPTSEVDVVTMVPLAHALDGENYELIVRSERPYRANYSLPFESIRIGGPTASLLITLYQALGRTAARAHHLPS